MRYIRHTSRNRSLGTPEKDVRVHHVRSSGNIIVEYLLDLSDVDKLASLVSF